MTYLNVERVGWWQWRWVASSPGLEITGIATTFCRAIAKLSELGYADEPILIPAYRAGRPNRVDGEARLPVSA